MLKRKMNGFLENWLSQKYALLVDGARQVGKTFILREFSKTHFEVVAYLNFFENKSAVQVIRESKSAKDFLFRISTLAGIELVPHKTVIFLDEIQELKDFDLITLSKFLVDEGSYRFIFSGSLLGVELYDVCSWPTGYLAHATMYPLDFEEFLWANNVPSATISRVRECFEKQIPVEDFIHEKFLDLFAKYILVGGMPDAVNAFVETNNFSKVELAHQTIEEYNRKDIAKYADENEKLKIKEIYDLLPSELNSKTKRFKLSDIETKKRSTNIELSFSWLKSAGVAIPVYTATAPEIPLRINEERSLLKLFHEDTGLLTHILMDSSVKVKILNQEKDINFGAIYENVVAQLLTVHCFEKLYFFNNKKLGEVDFLVEKDSKVLPLEIKSGKAYEKHSALNNLLNKEQFDIPCAYIFCNENVSKKNKCVYFPIYMVEFLRKRERYF